MEIEVVLVCWVCLHIDSIHCVYMRTGAATPHHGTKGIEFDVVKVRNHHHSAGQQATRDHENCLVGTDIFLFAGQTVEHWWKT